MAGKLSKGEATSWTGILTLLERHKKTYKFLNLYWHLIREEDGSAWALGYENQALGSSRKKKFKIVAFTRDFKLPEDARPLCSGGEHVICLQTSNDVIYLLADSQQTQERFLGCLVDQLGPPPIPHGLTASSAPLPQTSHHMYSAGYLHDNHRYALSPSPRLAFGYRQTQPDGLFKHAYLRTGSADVNDEGTLLPDTYMSYRSPSFYGESELYESPPLPPRSSKDSNPWKQRKHENNLPVKENDKKLMNDYPTSSERQPSEGASEISSVTNSTDEVKNLRTPPIREREANMWGNDSPRYPAEETKRTYQSLPEFVQTFRSQKFRGPIDIKLQKPNMNWKAVKLCRVKEGMITVAGLSPSMYSVLHVGDVIMKVNNQGLPFTGEFYELINSCGTDEVELEVLRVPNGCLCHVTLRENGRIDCLGLSFADRKKRGVEVISISEDGLVFKSNHLPGSCTEGIADSAKRVNWGLVEINQTPLPLDSSKEQVEELLRNAGIELVLVFLPMDLVHLLRDSSCANIVEGVGSASVFTKESSV